MKTEQLILQLSRDTQPVSIFMPVKSWLLWTLVPITVMILRFFLWQTQSPNLTKNIDLYFFLETFLLAVLFGLVPYLTFKQSVPGFKSHRAMILTVGLFAAWIFLLIFRASSADLQETHSADFFQGVGCSFEILKMSLLPLLVIFLILKRGAAINPLRSGLMASASATMMGTLVLQVICQSPSSAHVLVFHFGAVLLVSLAGAVLGNLILRW